MSPIAHETAVRRLSAAIGKLDQEKVFLENFNIFHFQNKTFKINIFNKLALFFMIIFLSFRKYNTYKYILILVRAIHNRKW